MAKMVWRECTMVEALRFADGKTITSGYPRVMNLNPTGDAEVVWFTDGTAVASKSGEPKCTFGGSEVTPSDWEAGKTQWWTGAVVMMH